MQQPTSIIDRAIRLAKIQKVKRLQFKAWREDPMLWLKDRLKEDPLDYQWSKRPGYEDHKWDGTIDPLYEAWMAVANRQWAAVEAATGCHAKGQPILMYDGTIKLVEQVVVGDRLMGDDSKPRNVLSLARGKQKMYKIIPVKGDPFEVNEDHILSLKRTCPENIDKGRYHKLPLIKNVSVKDYLGWSKKQKHIYKLYRTGVDFEKKQLTIAPYFLGLWIGDGSAHRAAITTVDPEIINYIYSIASRNGYEVSVSKQANRTKTYFLTHGPDSCKANSLSRKLRLTVINGEKRIPFDYLTSSRKQRLQLLAGLIDSDGCYNDCYVYSTIYSGLRDDILYLCRSLGFAAYYTEKDAVCNGVKLGTKYQHITISGDLHTVPVKLSRKKATVREQVKRVTVTGFKVKELSKDDYYGFELDGNHLYLLGDFTVTHNTSKTFMLARVVLWFLDCYPDSLVVTSAPKQDQLKLNLWAEIGKIFHKFKRIRPNAQTYNLRLVADEKSDNEEFDPNSADLSKSWHAVGFVAGVGSEETSATKAQGFHRENMLLVLEEAPGMPEAILQAFKNTCTGENNVILAVGNPDSELDPLHTFAELPHVKHVRISAYDYPNVVQNKEIMKGAVTRTSIQRRKDEYGIKSPLYMSRVRGISPAQSTDSLIQAEWVDAAFVSKIKYDGGYHAVGVDVANSLDGDKAALAWGKSALLFEVQDFYCSNANHLAYNLIMDSEGLAAMGYDDYHTRTLKDYDVLDNMIGVDPVGVGAGTINTLTDSRLDPLSLTGKQWDEAIPVEEYTDDAGKVISKPMYRFQNLRSQMYWELREDLRRGKLSFAHLPDDKELRDAIKKELVAIKVSYKDNYIAVEKKDDLKKRIGGKSPNKMDAIVYWNWTRKGYRTFSKCMPIG